MKRRNLIGMGFGLLLATVCGVGSLDEVRGQEARYVSQVMRLEKKMDKVTMWLEAELKTKNGATVKLDTEPTTVGVDILKASAEAGDNLRALRNIHFARHKEQMDKLASTYGVTVPV